MGQKEEKLELGKRSKRQEETASWSWEGKPFLCKLQNSEARKETTDGLIGRH